MAKQKAIKPVLFILVLMFSLISPAAMGKVEASHIRSIIFPVIGKFSYSNDYNAPRDGGTRTHHAIDIIAKKGQRLVAVANGRIVDVQYPQPSWGYSVTIQDNDGYRYRYIHMNDDNPGTNDGKGGGMHAYAADVKEGNRVKRGQLLGWVGDSGRANGIPHLHFEMFKPNGSVINPYESLKRSNKISSPKNYPQLASEILPAGTSFKSKRSIDVGNFDLDGNTEIVTGPGKGGHTVRIFETNKTQKVHFEPNRPSFNGGVDVAAGDIDGDGVDNIITGAGVGGSYVKVFEADGTEITGFAPFGSDFGKGIFVAAGDVDGDGMDEIIAGTGPGTRNRISVFEPDGTRLRLIYAFSDTFSGGVDVASADVIGDTNDEIIASKGPGGQSRVKIWQLDGTLAGDFYPYSESFRGGARISAGNVRTSSAKSEILTVPASKGSPLIKMFNVSGSELKSHYFMEKWWKGYHDVAASEGFSRSATGLNRRDSIRQGIE